jgi:alpha-D-xyloside xylohydrolase
MLTSHSRCHGAPPKEPWEYGKEFNDYFRATVEVKYKLMPYIYAQSKLASEKGLPMVRALFVEYPEDPGAWLVDNEYLFGSDILVAPLFENVMERDVYLPKGKWIDYQTGKIYTSGWNHIQAGKIEAIILVRDGAILPHLKLAQSTMDMDWSNIELITYIADASKASGYICLPTDNQLIPLNIMVIDHKPRLDTNALTGKVKFSSRIFTDL